MKQHPSLFVLILVLLVAFFLVVGGAAAAPKDGPLVTLASSQVEYSTTQEVVLTVTFSNPTGHSVRVLKWFTPVNGLEEPVFAVRRDGEPVAYTGAVYKRPAATGNDYLTLKAGQSISYEVNLGDYYDLSVSGQYEIAYRAESEVLFSEKGNGLQGNESLTSETLSLKVEGRAGKRPPPQPTPPAGGTSFNVCTTTQQNTLLSARDNAKGYASESENYLKALSTGTARYIEWFGVFTSSRLNTVTTNFTKLSDAWDNAGVVFDCSCKQNYYAYVYPSQPYKIYLCKVFWTAPATGTDSKAGTLIHEMSHFNVVAGTDDYVYGQTGARNLAITDPNKAVNNADNHEYFAENNPKLP